MRTTWRRTWDWWTGGAGRDASDVPVRAAEWLVEHRGRPSPAAYALVLVAAVTAAVIDLTAEAGAGLLWAPVVVLCVSVRAQVLTAVSTLVAVGVGVVSDLADDEITGIVLAGAGFRALGLVTVALLASWALLATAELTRRSRTDPGTGLLNRAGFLAALERERERALRQASSLSLVYLDVDGLKDANDTWGHAYGDEVLSRFATHLDRSRRIVDVAARLGGDEFALLLPATDTRGVEQVLRRLFHAIDADERCLPASAGAVTWSRPPTLRAMLDQADDVMYQAKASGGRAWVTLDLGTAGQPDGDEGVSSWGALHEWRVRR